MPTLENETSSGPSVVVDSYLYQLFPKLDKDKLSQIFVSDLEQIVKFFKVEESKLHMALAASPVKFLEIKLKRPGSSLNGTWQPNRGELVVYIDANLFTLTGEDRRASVADLGRVFRHEVGHAFHQLLAGSLKIEINHEQVFSSEAFAEMIYVLLNNNCDPERIKTAFKQVVTRDSKPFKECIYYPYPPDNDVKKLDAALLYFVYQKYGLKKLMELIKRSPANTTGISERIQLLPFHISHAFNSEMKWPMKHTEKMTSRLRSFYAYLSELVGRDVLGVIDSLYNFYQM